MQLWEQFDNSFEAETGLYQRVWKENMLRFRWEFTVKITRFCRIYVFSIIVSAVQYLQSKLVNKYRENMHRERKPGDIQYKQQVILVSDLILVIMHDFALICPLNLVRTNSLFIYIYYIYIYNLTEIGYMISYTNWRLGHVTNTDTLSKCNKFIRFAHTFIEKYLYSKERVPCANLLHFFVRNISRI